MKKLFSLIFLISAISCSNFRHLNKFHGYNSNPKLVESISIETVGNEEIDTIRKPLYKSVSEFDREGRIIKSTAYNPDESLNYYVKYEYFKNGRIIKRSTYKPHESLNSYVVKEYLKNGNIKQISHYSADSTISSQRSYHYNKKNQLIKLENNSVIKLFFYKENNLIRESGTRKGKFYYNSYYEYNNKNQKIELRRLKKNGSLKNIIRFNYDSFGNTIETNWYNKDEKLYEIYRSEYDSLGNRTKSEKYNVKNSDTVLIFSGKTIYKFDRNRNIVQSITESENIKSIIENTFIYWE